MRTVVKLGGRSLDDPATLQTLFRGLADAPGDFVIVHGGGNRISAWLEKAGLPVEFRDGLRVTTPEAMEVTEMVLCGSVNEEIVRALESLGVAASGMSGQDGACVRATIKGDGSLGRVGSVSQVDPTLLGSLMNAGIVPVLAPVSLGDDGGALNVNADEVALAVAVAVGADRLLMISDVPGVLVDGQVVSILDAIDAAEMVALGKVTGGMAVKVNQALEAANQGLEVVIGDAGALCEGCGTVVMAGRRAEVAA